MKGSKGQTLLEVVVVIAVVAIVLTALVSAVTAALRFGQSSQSRSRSVKLAQDGLEVARRTRDSQGWSTFFAYSQSNSGRWCLDAQNVFSQAPANGSCPVSNGSTFWRLLTFTWNAADSLVEVHSRVTWGLRDSQSTVDLITYFTEWK